MLTWNEVKTLALTCAGMKTQTEAQKLAEQEKSLA